MIAKVLIANRGEIACRIMRTAHRLGIATVAVYSDADADTPHVRMASQSVRLGPAAAAESYLRADKIIEAAKLTGADSIHPGYGFLSENADFADAVREAGIIFIGPPADAIRAMGAKDNAKAIMESAGVPVVPGYYGDDQTDERLAQSAAEIGYPVLLKAALGGGGKGMRVVEQDADLTEAAAAACREGEASFGDGRLLIEKYLQKPRHVEVQVFADSYGNTVHLFERDCSLQRRHQKVIEEAPAFGMDECLRQRMGEAAVNAAKAVKYENAGTVEFLLDSDGGFYFMEMNTRLQVEHPVTELVTGQDLVEWQFHVADGGRLPLAQDQLHLTGHAIEARLYAEDPDTGFLPAPGHLAKLDFPAESKNVRIDSGVVAGGDVSPHYDPMIAKVIVWDEDRDAACRRMSSALADIRAVGPTINRDFLSYLIQLDEFRAHDVDTGLIDRLNPAEYRSQTEPDMDALIAASVHVLTGRAADARVSAERRGDPHSPWSGSECWRVNDTGHQDISFSWAKGAADVTALQEGNCYVFHIDLEGMTSEFHVTAFPASSSALSLEIDNRKIDLHVTEYDGEMFVFSAERMSVLRLNDPAMVSGEAEFGQPVFAAPMPGKVVAVNVKADDKVSAGQTLIVLEAMKMEHAIKAPVDGRISAVHYEVGDQVGEGADLLSFEGMDEDE